MSAQPHHPHRPASASTQSAGGNIETLASMLEYVQRLNAANETLAERLADLGPEFLVLGPGRVEEWHVEAIVVGPPGIFLIWPIWSRAERMLWQSSELCRQHIREQLGPRFSGAVEIVFFSGGEVDSHMERHVFSGGAGLPWFDVLAAEGDLAHLITDWQPTDGMQRLSPEWINQLRADSQPRWTLDGPDHRAEQRPVVERTLHS